jgi:hypothetical protein
MVQATAPRAIEPPQAGVGTTASSRPSAGTYLAVAVVAGATVALQVLLTRLMSAAVFYHFTFLAVSLALLGSGAGAILVYVRPSWFGRRPVAESLARWSAVLAVLLAACPIVLVRLDYLYLGFTTQFAWNLAIACAVAATPFLVAGIVLTLALRAYAHTIGPVYAADLIGAGLGAFVVIPMMWLADAPTLMLGSSAVVALASALFAGGRQPVARLCLVLALSCTALTAASRTISLVYLPPAFSVPTGATQVGDRWTPISRVVGYAVPDTADFALVFYDRVYAPVFRHRAGEPFPDWRSLRLGPQTIGYALTGPGNALIIGGGGGRDIYNALSSGQQTVDVIELNAGVRQVVDVDLAEVSGSPYSLPGVTTVVGDGRSTLARSGKRYDQIHLSFTDTLSANSASAFALTENNLYTLEAFAEYLDHLNPRGVLNVSRLYRLASEEALRATILTLEALRRHGVEDPRRNVVVVLGRDILHELFGTVLARLEPYSADELATIKALADERGLGIAFAPDGPYFAEWGELAKAADPLEFCRSYHINVCPPTDDQPFFFNMKRLSDTRLWVTKGEITSADPMLLLLLTFGILLLLSLFAYALPLVAVRSAPRPPASALVFFAAIGVGYMVLEIALIQRFVLFLGFPTYALSVVLFALLVFTGLGSVVATRFANPRATLTVALTGTIALIAGTAFGLLPVLRSLIELGLATRIAISIALIAPFGLTMGAAMPIGLRRLEALHPGGLPYAFGVNGTASVVASVMAAAIAINFGFTVASLLAAACYLLALVHAATGVWPESTRQ